MAKKYYFFKLKDDFFNTLEVKKLRKLAGGDTLTIIYLEMILESLKYGGKLYYEGVDETFESEMALKINENVENVSLTLAYLLKHGLIEKGTDETYALTQVESNILGETSSAERVRRCRAKKKALHCNTSVTGKEAQALPSSKIVNGDIDIELEKELDIDKEDIKDNIVHQDAQREPKKPNKKEISEEARQKTESLWKLYPLKKGKSTAVKKIPKLLKKYTFKQIKTCIERYIQDVEHRRKTGFKELKFQNGSTFFNGTFEDYLDENWKEGCNGQNNNSTTTTENTPAKETEGDRLFRLAKEKYGDTAFQLDDNEYDF